MTIELDKDEASWLSRLLTKLTKSKVNKTIHYYENHKEEDLTTLEPIYSAYGEVDGHGDAYKDSEGPYQLVKALSEGKNKGTLQYSLFHIHKTKLFEMVDAWVNEEDYDLGDGRIIKAGMPVGVFKHKTQAMYNLRMNGTLQGLSIGALGKAELVKDLLSQLRVSEKPLRLLSDFIFTHKAAHIAYTSMSQGGAASNHNEHFNIMKSKYLLDEEQAKVLEELGEEFLELDKSQFTGEVESESKTAPSTSDEALDAGVDNETVNKGQEMSVELENKVAELEKKLLAKDLKETLVKYKFDAEVSEAVSLMLAEVSEAQRSVVVKALDAIVEAAEARVSAVEAEKEELSKSVETLQKSAAPVTPVEVEMNKELGTTDAQERGEPSEAEIRKANRALAKKSLNVK